jgi:pimeloyl-ACP methyl ester carboxylesterase
MISDAFGKNINAEVPEGVFSKSCEIERFLLNYLEDLTLKNKVNHIYFVGHSLGGSISTALLVMHKSLLNKFRLIPATAITVGAPLIFSKLPEDFGNVIYNDSIDEISTNLNNVYVDNNIKDKEDNEKDVNITPIYNKEFIRDIHDNIHNIVYQLDIMPRLLGQHEMPQYIKEKDALSYFDKWAKEEGNISL